MDKAENKTQFIITTYLKTPKIIRSFSFLIKQKKMCFYSHLYLLNNELNSLGVFALKDNFCFVKG